MAKFITLHIFHNPIEAEIVRGKLESEGIRAYILDQNLAYTIGPTINTGYRLQVPQDRYIKAKQILEKSLENQ